jgi:hypothetical protein
MKSFLPFLFAVIVLGLSACNSPETTTPGEPEKTEAPKSDIQALPENRWNELMQQCSGLDITLYTLGFSISATGCEHILPLIERTAPGSLGGEEFGHVLFLINGQMFSIAKVYLSNNQSYMRFELEEGVFYQSLNDAGASYFKNLETLQPK